MVSLPSQDFTECESGCQCPSGLVDDGKGSCVRENQCPCQHDGHLYAAGAQIPNKCNSWYDLVFIRRIINTFDVICLFISLDCTVLYLNISYTSSTCKSGKWECTEKKCPGTCTIYGSGHYSTFDEKSYAFQGDCAYLAVTVNKECKHHPNDIM